VVGAILRGSDREFWVDTLDLLRKADLSAIEDQLPEGQQNFFRAVEVSFQSLKPEMQERYKALAVLLEDMAAPFPILKTLWNVNEAEARRIKRSDTSRSTSPVVCRPCIRSGGPDVHRAYYRHPRRHPGRCFRRSGAQFGSPRKVGSGHL